MSLDTRARHAVRSLQESVVRATPVALPTVTRRHRASLVAGLVGALAIAFGSIALAAMLPETTGDDTATVTSLVPDPEIPDGDRIALPDHGDLEEGVFQHNATSTAFEPYTKFYGTGTPGAAVTAFSAYGVADTVVGENGEFTLKLFFENPPSGIAFPVTLTVGDEAHEFDFTWLWDPQNVAISAHQGYGQSGAPAPFEKFFGTAPPGTHVAITSAYGSAETEAGDNGEWFKKVWFEGAPLGESFPITVTVGDQVFEFDFLWTYDGSVEFALHQEGTTSDSASPYTRFVGTATPGTTIVATSAYGSADMVVGESGEFSLKVWFSGAPNGVKFPITVKVDGETYGTYYFTWYHGDGGGETGDVVVEPIVTESDSPSPYAKVEYWAPKNTKIQLVSEYGSSSVITEYTGSGHLKLFFSTLPPAGQPFTVTIKVNDQVYDTFQFTSWFQGTLYVEPIITEGEGESPYAKVEYWAPAGTTIQLVSDYGSSAVTTSSSGSGHLKLFFGPDAPKNTAFPVIIKVNGGVYETFQFTWWYEVHMDPSAFATWGECAENPPYDEYYGTAAPGTTITISSAYGGGSTTSNSGGDWYKKVFFETAPVGESFQVTVTVGDTPYYFWFIRTA